MPNKISDIKKRFICKSCDNQFFVYPSRIRMVKKTNRKILYCSWGCWKKENAKGINKKCIVCSKEFYSSPSKAKSKYCSKTCMGLAWRNEKSPLWKGEKIGYAGLHHWLYRNYKRSYFCFNCMKHKLYMDWANVTGIYKRDIKNFVTLCRKCHNRYDKGLLKIVLTKYEK